MEWLHENLFGMISLFFGAGGIGFAIISKILDRKKYSQEVRGAAADADIKGDEFWKKRYDVLSSEMTNKDNWWQARYNTLDEDYQRERQLSNEVVKSFRSELSEMRKEYEEQREVEKSKYDNMLKQYRDFVVDSDKRESEYKQRIAKLEELVNKYEQRLGNE